MGLRDTEFGREEEEGGDRGMSLEFFCDVASLCPSSYLTLLSVISSEAHCHTPLRSVIIDCPRSWGWYFETPPHPTSTVFLKAKNKTNQVFHEWLSHSRQRQRVKLLSGSIKVLLDMPKPPLSSLSLLSLFHTPYVPPAIFPLLPSAFLPPFLWCMLFSFPILLPFLPSLFLLPTFLPPYLPSSLSSLSPVKALSNVSVEVKRGLKEYVWPWVLYS